MVVLECSSKGDKRFSALYAKVDIYLASDTIENLYQLSKRFKTKKTGKIVIPTDFKHAKKLQKNDNYTLEYFIIPGDDIKFKLSSLSNYYDVLWYKYFLENPYLFEYIKKFDKFTDYYKSYNTINCQADTISRISKVKTLTDLEVLYNGTCFEML